jgi:hypothetical protein
LAVLLQMVALVAAVDLTLAVKLQLLEIKAAVHS